MDQSCLPGEAGRVPAPGVRLGGSCPGALCRWLWLAERPASLPSARVGSWRAAGVPIKRSLSEHGVLSTRWVLRGRSGWAQVWGSPWGTRGSGALQTASLRHSSAGGSSKQQPLAREHTAGHLCCGVHEATTPRPGLPLEGLGQEGRAGAAETGFQTQPQRGSPAAVSTPPSPGSRSPAPPRAWLPSPQPVSLRF